MGLGRQFGCVALVLGCTLAVADEGMWTFDNPPLKQLQEKYNFTPTKAWLDHVRLACVRLNDGGSGSFVSPNGLLLTNHHVARTQLQKNSSPEHDYIRNGFYAARQADELKSPDLEVNVLASTENVTARVEAAIQKASTPEEQFAARRAVSAEIERESLKSTGLRSDVIALYHGGEYWLYRYRKYTDVRLVFAPEQQIAFFGGDPDNFTFPRYDIDMALFRVYENGRPLETKDYLRWNSKGAAEGDLVFVSGHPASTQRMDTVAQLEFERDVREPFIIRIYKRRIEDMRRYSDLGAEQARQAASQLFLNQNALKSAEGRYRGLADPQTIAIKREAEADFRQRVVGNPEWKQTWGSAWDDMAAAERKAATRAKEQYFRGTNSDLSALAANIIDYVAEIGKPDAERLPGFHEAQLATMRYRLVSPAPVYSELEIARMTGALELGLEELGANDPFIKIELNGKTPRQAAIGWIAESKLADPALRRKLIEGGEEAVRASEDPMIVLQRRLDPLRREMIAWQQDHVQSLEQRASALLAKARFAVYGRTTYPDATFTLRLSYGSIAGYPMNGTQAPSKTTLYGLFDRAASFNFDGPYGLPSRYLEGRAALDLSTPTNLVSTNDISGGNSGSPLVNRAGEIVGLVFDGNIESLAGNFVYDPTSNRTISVTTNVMTEVLRKLYGAQKLLDELTQ